MSKCLENHPFWLQVHASTNQYQDSTTSPMKLTSTFAVAAVCQAAALALPVDHLEKRDTVKGFDISHYQATVNYQGAYNSGARFVIIKVTFPPLISLSPAIALTRESTPGHRRNNLHRPQILATLQRRHSRRPNPRRLPLRPSRLQLRRRPSNLLRRPRRRLVRRRQDPPRNARHGIRHRFPRRHMSRTIQNQHGELDYRFREHVSRQDEPVADDLHDERLVGHLYWE